MLVVHYLSAQKNIYLNYMKYPTTKTKKLLNLSICLFSLALVGCSPEPKRNTRRAFRTTPTSITSTNEEPGKDNTKNAPVSTPPNQVSKPVIDKDKDDILCHQYNWSNTPTTINQQPNNPTKTEDDSKLLQEFKDHCKTIETLSDEAKKILSDIEGIQGLPRGSIKLRDAIPKLDKIFQNFSSRIKEAKETNETLQASAEKASGNNAADIKNLASEAQANLDAVNNNCKNIEERIKSAKHACPPEKNRKTLKNYNFL